MKRYEVMLELSERQRLAQITRRVRMRHRR